MKATEFVAFCEELALANLPRELPRPERKVMWTILQLYYGSPEVHFEVQPHVGRGIIELGLHFEGQPEANEAWAGLVAARAHELSAALGPAWELEEWTASWRRLHRTWRFEQLTGELGREVAGQLRTALAVLQPVLVEGRALLGEPVAPRRPPPSEHRREWRHSARTTR
jgi:hypothetical protein